jgi:hypothetical protein
MAHTQMTDRNLSDLGFMEELTDEELLAINGGMPIWPVTVIWSIRLIFPKP